MNYCRFALIILVLVLCCTIPVMDVTTCLGE
jgi:hypothetical protein